MSHLSRVVALAAVGLSLPAASASAAATWAPTTVVAPAKSSGPVLSDQVRTASDGAGNLTAAWFGNSAGQTGVQTSTRAAGSTTWTTPTLLAATAATATDLDLQVNASGQAIAAWSDADSGLRIAARTNGTWGAPVAPPGVGALDAFALALLPSGGTVGLLAVNNAGGNATLKALTGALPTLTVGSAPSPTSAEFSIALDAAGNATVVYFAADTGHVATATRSASGTWSTPTVLDGVSPSPSATEPRIAVDAAGDAVASWLNPVDPTPAEPESGDEIQTVFAASRKAGGAWSAPVKVAAKPTAEGYLFQALLGIDDAGSATLAWQEIGFTGGGLTFVSTVRTATASPAGAWSAPSSLSPAISRNLLTGDGKLFGPMSLAVGRDGSAVLASTSGSGAVPATPATDTDPAYPAVPGNADVQGVVRTADGSWGDWSLLADVPDAPPADPATIDTSLDATGRATVAWTDGSAVRSRSASTGDATPVTTPTPAATTTPAPTPTAQAPAATPTPAAPAATPTPAAPAATPKPAPAPTPTPGKPLSTPVGPKVVIAMYVIPSGRKCPARVTATIDAVRTPLTVKGVKKKGRLLCRVSGTVAVKTGTKAGTKVSVLITAKGIKKKKVTFPAVA